MTYEFCTLFDRVYLPRALVLYRTLVEHAGDFRLRAFCMDTKTHELLTRLELERLQLIRLDELERHDAGLLATKPTRAPVEYYWTSTPASVLYCLEREPELESITYLDADLMFFSSPQPIFDELGDESVLIVPHRFPPRLEAELESAGTYNVQFMTFRRTDEGLEALRWWRERCLEWCYARVEDGKFGDQKYLDDWPTRFAGVHTLRHLGAGLAPWNVEQYRLQAGNPPTVNGQPLIFFHYHGLRLHGGLAALTWLGLLPQQYGYVRGPHPIVWTGNYPVRPHENQLIWKPYVRRLGQAISEVRRVDPTYDAGLVPHSPREVGILAARRAARLPLGGARRLLNSRVPLRRRRSDAQ